MQRSPQTQPPRRTPPSFRRATWRCTLPHDSAEGVIGIGLNVDGGVVRYALDTRSAQGLLETLAQFLGYAVKSPAGTQSPTSPLMPSSPSSAPSEGENVCPPAASATAATTSP